MKNSNKKVAIIGSGAWGCSIADLIAKNGFDVFLYVRDKLNHKISKKVTITTDFSGSIEDANFIFIVICSKGIETKTSKLFSQIIEKKLTNNYAIFSGPNFASEVALEIPTITTIASKKKAVANHVCQLLKNDYFLPITSNDVITTEISGAIKNIIAIGCGIIDGVGFGDNTKAALVVNGSLEINALSKKIGGKTENILSPAGFGDLFLTCSSTKSRNYSLGLQIGKGIDAKKILSDKKKTYEGVAAAKSMISLAKKYKINLTACSAINKILSSDLNLKEIKQIIHQSIITK
jgi:glycerol-3-phosphate dehydrogenase (NAD(P)+)